MNSNIKGSIVKVKRGTFTDKTTGELRSYCQFFVLVSGPTNENETGFDYEKFSCKIENYSSIVNLIKDNKPVDVLVEMVKQKDDTYKRRAIKVGDIVL